MDPAPHLCRYRYLEDLGRGAQGVVRRARDLATGAAVVIKSSKEGARAALRREYALLAGVSHPNIVQVFDIFDEDGSTHLVQSFAPGRDFLAWLGEAHSGDARQACLAGAAVLRGLQLLHARGLVHRDVKPANLRIADEPIGRLPGVRLIDFGLASAQPEAVVAGTLAYAAPEVLAGGVAGPPADIYSLGAVLYEALFERLPNPLLDPSASAVEVPPLDGRAGLLGGLLRELLSDMLHPMASQRPTAALALATLAEVVGEPLQVSADELAGPYYPRPTLIGRDEPLAALERLLDEAVGGRGRAVHLDGCGKTAVVRALTRRARLHGVLVIDAERVAGELAGAGATIHGASVEQLVTRVVDGCIERSREAPLLLALDGLDAGQALVVPLLRQLLGALTELGRCLLLFSGPLPRQLDPRAAEAFVELQLDPLDDADVVAMVSTMLHHLEPPRWLPELQRVARGDPRWIAELVGAQIEARLPATLVGLSAGAQTDHVGAGRLDVLAEDQRRVLQLVARAPDAVPLGVLRAVAGSGCDEALAALAQRELITLGVAGVRLVSVGLQRAVASRGDASELEQDHSAYVEAWRTHGGEEPRRHEHLAHHLLRAGQAVAAAPLLLSLPGVDDEELTCALAALPPEDPCVAPLRARLARRRRAHGELAAALDLAAGDAMLHAELLLDAGRPAAALEALQTHVGASAAYQRLLARARFLLGDYLGAASAAAEGQRLLGDGDHPELAVELAVLAGLAEVYRGDAETGLARLQATAPAAAALDAPLLLARLHNSMGIAQQRLGRLDEARPAYEVCLAQARRSGDLRVAATAALNLGTIAHRQGRWGQALERYREAGGLATRAAIGTTRISALANEANLLLVFGELELAEARLKSASALAVEAGVPSLRCHVALYLAELALVRGDVEGAARRVGEAEAAQPVSDRAAGDALDLTRCELLLAQRRPRPALELAVPLLTRMDADDPDRWRAHLLAGKAQLALGRGEQATRELERALATAGASGAVERRWECHALLVAGYRDTDPEAAEFHVARFERELAALRIRVPAAHREAFDGRLELRQAAETLRRGGVAAGTGPSRRDLLRLLELNKELNRRLPLDELLLRVLDRALALTGAERGFILLEQNGGLGVAASRNVDREAARRGVDRFSRTIAARALADQQPVLASDAMADERFAERLSVRGLKLRAVLCVPLSAGETRGALYLDNRFRADAFGAGHVALVQVFADQAAIALYNASLLRDEAKHRQALERAKGELEAANHQLQSEVTRKSQQLSEISHRLRAQEEELVRRYNAARIIGRSKPMRALYAQLDRVAESDVPVVIHGESGTGKELVARALHYMSPRSRAPFITVNCGAVPPSLIESELFGHARGAFTGALSDRAGLFDVAGEGTLLLDEVGDMPPEMQVKLLRVLQEGSYRRVGDEHERKSRCRVLAASHQRLMDLVERGLFREDLYYRLNVVTLEVPALRERREDIPQLVEHFVERGGRPLPVTPAAMAALIDFDWPGNVRQLENELQRATLLADVSVGLADLSPELRAARRTATRRWAGPSQSADEGLQQALQDYERQLIEHALDHSGFNVSQAARALGLHRVALHRKIRKHGLERSRALQ